MARLTETEKQEIIRYLEAGKPLPEKYCFLLFEEKREVEIFGNRTMKNIRYFLCNGG